MAVTYNAGTNTITVVGYTEAAPCTFTTIYNADVAGGWGVVSRQCTDQFCSSAKIVIGDGSTVTYLKTTNEQIVFNVCGGDVLHGATNSYFYMGNNPSGNECKDGSVIIFGGLASISTIRLQNAYIYNSKIVSLETGGFFPYGPFLVTVHCDMKYTDFYGNFWFIKLTATTGELYKIRTIGTSSLTNGSGLREIGTTGSIDDVECAYNTTNLNISYAGAITCRNLNLHDFYGSGVYSCDVGLGAYTGTSTLIDSVVGQVNSWGVCSGLLYTKYSLNLKVVDKNNSVISGATVKIWDVDDSLVVDTTTGAGGTIAEQLLFQYRYHATGGCTNLLPEKDYNPHTIEITKVGYTTYEADFTIEEKTDWLIALQTSILRNPSMTGGMA